MGTLSSTYPPRQIHGLLWTAFLFVCIVVLCGTALAQTVPRMIASAPAASSPLLLPSDVAFDRQGNLFFSDTNHHVVERFDTSGALTVVAGNGIQGFAGDGGLATAAELDSPMGLAVDGSGNLFLADTHNHRVRRVDAGSGKIGTVAGNGVAGFGGDGGLATQARLSLPSALAVDGGGNLYIVDTNNHRVRRVDAATETISTAVGNGQQGFAGEGGVATVAAIDSPGGIAVDALGNLYIADTHNQRLRRVDTATGMISTVAGEGAGGFAGDGGSALAARLTLPRGVSIDSAGNIYVADTNNQRVRRIASDGTITTVAGDGVQSFRGDGGPAVAASLNSPRGVAVSPAGLTTLADSGNQRMRQVEANATIVTLVGLDAGSGATGAEALVLSAPHAVYGGGAVTATLSDSLANGSVVFYQASAAATNLIGAVPLVGGVASLSTGSLNVGTYPIYASYAGDAGHAAATSAIVSLMVEPAPVTASVGPVSILYGQSAPALSGTISGVLARDLGAVSLQLSSAAQSLSPVGSYPIAGVLGGAAGGNYTLAPLAAAVVIGKAGSAASLSDGSVVSVANGTPVRLAVHIASSTSGVPTGSVTLVDGAMPLGTAPLSSTGDAVYTATGLATGTHALEGVYSGDGNFTGATTGVATVAVASPPAADFTIATTGAASQTVPAGTPANFSFTVQMEGGTLTSAITLAASGLPTGTTASFNPGTVVPGGANAFQLTVMTAASPATAQVRRLGTAWAVLLLPWFGFRVGRRRIAASLFLVGLLALAGCGASVMAVPAAAKSYPITVLGTATSATGAVLQHTATVTLTVQ